MDSQAATPAAQGTAVFQDHWEKVKAEIENELLALVNQLTGVIAKNTPIAANALAGSFEPMSEFSPMKAFIGVGSPLWYGAGGYGEYVELGTKPHWAPIEPLIRWVEQKIQPHVLAVGVEFSSGKAMPTRKGTKKLTGDARQLAIQSIARAIQIKIAKKGTDAQMFVWRSLNELGLPADLVLGTEEESYYQIDIAAWLENRLPAILDRVNT
jgi:hypothetical protein